MRTSGNSATSSTAATAFPKASVFPLSFLTATPLKRRFSPTLGKTSVITRSAAAMILSFSQRSETEKRMAGGW